MAKQALNGVLRHIRKLAAVQTGRALADRELLERFVEANDEAAFTVLVERHGPMVHGVCARVLRNSHDADDACQAAFLVLARKAASVRKKASIGSWLHGVACRVAADLKRQNARRQRREQVVPPPAPRDADAEISWREVQTVLDEELERLPERYRAPLVLCYLEGKTRDEAARQLGLTAGRLHGRLERGRDLLRQRLTRRGLTLSAALFATALGESAAPAALAPTAVVASTKAAVLFAGGQALAKGAVAPHVLSLTQGVLQVMFLTKVKIATALVLGAGLLTALAGGSLPSTGIAQEAKAPAAKATPAAKTETDEAFIRRISKDLRGSEPTPAEVHFFVANKDAGKRQKLIDLFIQERQAKKDRQVKVRWPTQYVEFVRFLDQGTYRADVLRVPPPRFGTIQGNFYKELLAAQKEKKDVATITQNYLDRLLRYVKDHPKNDDVPDAMLQIALVYRSQGKEVEADAWRDKLLKEYPQSPAAKTAKEAQAGAAGFKIKIVPKVDVLMDEIKLVPKREDVPHKK